MTLNIFIAVSVVDLVMFIYSNNTMEKKIILEELLLKKSQ